jgi:hypothetical protein
MTYQDVICPICKEKNRVHGSETEIWLDSHIFKEHKKEWGEIAVITSKALEMGTKLKEKYGFRTIFVNKNYRIDRPDNSLTLWDLKHRKLPEGQFK